MDSQPVAQSETVSVSAQQPPSHSHFWAGKSFSFHDLLDAINPLQHLPVIGTLYRHFTGDQMGNVAEVVGDGIYGGVLGLASGVLNVAVKEITGKDIGENLISMVTGDDPPTGTSTVPPTAAAPPQESAPVANPAPTAKPTSDPAPADAEPQIAASDTPPPQANDAHASGVKPLPTSRGFIPIDTSARGILNLRAVAATHNPEPVALSLPPGTKLAPPAPPMDFAAKMREGLDKYQALMASRPAVPTAALDQVH
jgi:hypothetical protein